MKVPQWLSFRSNRRSGARALAKKSIVVATVATICALIPASAARADVIVPPNGSGHVCTGYKYVNSYLYWQTCAWADNNEVYFTVNLGNTSNYTMTANINIKYVRNGVYYSCPWKYNNWPVPPKSVNGTPTADCAISRTRAAYQANAIVSGTENTTDSLQVQ